jgi:hypothetical protein
MKYVRGLIGLTIMNVKVEGKTFVTDGDSVVRLWITGADNAIGLTPEEARYIAKCLVESSKRVEKQTES